MKFLKLLCLFCLGAVSSLSYAQGTVNITNNSSKTVIVHVQNGSANLITPVVIPPGPGTTFTGAASLGVNNIQVTDWNMASCVSTLSTGLNNFPVGFHPTTGCMPFNLTVSGGPFVFTYNIVIL